MSKRSIQRVAIVNRGEPAVRFIRGLRDYNAERGTSLQAIALVTHADLGAPMCHLADEVLRIGPAMQPGPDGALVSAYCQHDAILAAMERARCDAVWPGWGFVAEDPVFVSLLEARGITFLGPPAEAMRRLGDKIASKRLAERCGVPMAPWFELTDGLSDGAIQQKAREIGFPVMVKASAGGGGRGIRKVDDEASLLRAIPAARQEVAKVFGGGGLFVERCVHGARHVEVQLVSADDHHTIALGVRDCSVQRRNQKVLEETPSPVLPETTARALCEAAQRLATAAGYRSAGTAEFLYDPAADEAYFLEVNSRLQVEHTITECVTGADLVHAQLDVAQGLPLTLSGVDRGDGQPPSPRGHAIEARLCAEDAAAQFAPAPGLLRVFRPPSGPGVRVDSGVVEGTAIAAEFDSMIAKVIATGSTRKQAVARLRRALEELQVVVEDGATNKALLLELLRRDEVLCGAVDTGWLDRALAGGDVAHPRRAFEALAFAAVVEYRRRRRADVQAFFAAAQDGIPQNPPAPAPLQIDLGLAGRKLSVLVHDQGQGNYLAGPEDKLQPLVVHFDGDNAATLTVAGERHEVRYAYGRKGIAIEVDGAQCSVEPASGGALKAPAPAMVVQVSVQEGQRVSAGDRLLTLEAMKLEMPQFATEDGVVKRVLCLPNQQVAAGQVLIVVDSDNEGPRQGAEAVWPDPAPEKLPRMFIDGALDLRVVDAAPDDVAAAMIAQLVDTMRSVLLGYDQSERFASTAQALLGGDLDFSALQHPERWLPLVPLLECFADLEALFDRTLPGPTTTAQASPHTQFYELCRQLSDDQDDWPAPLATALRAALRWHGMAGADVTERTREALYRMHVAATHTAQRHQLCSLLLRAVIALHEAGVDVGAAPALQRDLDRIANLANPRHRYVADNARQAEYILFAQPRYVRRRQEIRASLERVLAQFADAAPAESARLVEQLATARDSLVPLLVLRADLAMASAADLLTVILRRTFSDSSCVANGTFQHPRGLLLRMLVDDADHEKKVIAALTERGAPSSVAPAIVDVIRAAGWQERELDIVVPGRHGASAGDGLQEAIDAAFSGSPLTRVTVCWHNGNGLRLRTFRPGPDGMREDRVLRDIHPDYARRFELHRLTAFDLTPIDTDAPVHAFSGRARENPRDERIFVYTGVREVPSADAIAADPDALWELERAYFEGLGVLRAAQADRGGRRRFHWNRLTIYVRRPVELTVAAIEQLSARLEAPTRGLGLEKVVVRCRLSPPGHDGPPVPRAVVIGKPGKHRLDVTVNPPSTAPVRAMSDYALKVVRARQLGTVYPYELARVLTGAGSGEPPHPDLAEGRFIEHDLADPASASCRLAPVDRAPGQNTAAVVVGLLDNRTDKHPEGLRRVWIAADATHSMCALAEPECRRVIGALDLAQRLEVPVEWVSISAGAKIAMNSGTENLDWTARVLRRLVEFTQAGGVVHVLVSGVNVGAQSYWNAEATMLMHTRGLLIMTADGSLVLTGKKALEYSGSVAAEDERGIGGFERVMGPNGQAQLFARDLGEAYALLMQHYRCAYRAPSEALPRRLASVDKAARSILSHPYCGDPDDGFATIGEIFDPAENPGRKRPFDVRAVMRATIDTDCEPLPRFGGMRDGETAVVWDAHLGGFPVCMIGVQSKPLQRRGRVPTDGPDTWTGGTLFPQSSKKVARAINAASANRPVVVLANLSGFDGSPESLRALQLEYGAEIGRAVVNFEGPILFVVIGRYHGGAYVVFSKALNAELQALALTGTYASVIGGAPAAAVVFPREVAKRVERDERVIAARASLQRASAADKPVLRERLQGLLSDVTLEKRGEVAAEFDAIHTVERAVSVGSLDAVIAPESLRPELIERLAAWWQRCAQDQGRAARQRTGALTRGTSVGPS